MTAVEDQEEEMELEEGDVASPRRVRDGVGLALGLAGSILIWILTPFFNFVLASCSISDSYLPLAASALLLFLVIALNPLLGRVNRALSLDRRQLALVAAILLIASAVAGRGLLSFLPYPLAHAPLRASTQQTIAERLEAADLPPSLFPEPIEYRGVAPAARDFVGELPPGEAIPWGKWIGPYVAWGSFSLFWWLFLLGLAALVLPQWKERENVSFPLLAVYGALTEAPDQEGRIPPLFRKKAFWIPFAGVLFIYLLTGLRVQAPSLFPSIPLSWDLSGYFASEPWRFLPSHMKTGRIYFIIVALTAFMSNRMAFSICFFSVVYAIGIMLVSAYLPPFHPQSIDDHRTGAMIVLTISILWLGRQHWREVILACVSRTSSPTANRDRAAMAVFLLGASGFIGWLFWGGAQLHMALFLLVIAFSYALLVTRVVAETGLVFMGFDRHQIKDVVRLIPIKWVSIPSAYFAGHLAGLIAATSHVCATTMGCHALALNEDRSPRFQSRLLFLFIGIFALGLTLGGASHLAFNYRHRSSLDGRQSPLNYGSVDIVSVTELLSEKLHKPDGVTWEGGRWSRPTNNQGAQIAFGISLAGLLQWACIAMPRWPLHPIGLLLVYTSVGRTVWISVLIGWILKLLLIRYGGVNLFLKARPCLLGLILGELMGAVFWGLVPLALVILGVEYTPVRILPG